MSTLILVCICVFALTGFFRAIQQSDMRKNNPEAFVRLQEMEHEKRLMRHENVKNVAGIGFTIAKMFMGK